GLIVGGGSEVRIGQGLAESRNNGPKAPRRWYFYASQQGRELTWTPSGDPASPGLPIAIESTARTDSGQAGAPPRRGPFQASVAMVKQSVRSSAGAFKASASETFAGLTFSWRR